ncbi:MAG: Uma2 family endonuclease [Panacagrimonas sp.]
MNLPASPQATKRVATYADIVALPENLVGEILDDELHVQPRPAGPHAVAESGLMVDLGSPFDRGRGGPGGWWILVEPELHLGRHVIVPDLAGWRRERMPQIPQDHRFTVSPDWVCEILSPSTARKDRIKKMRIYAEQGVAHCWLLDPLARTLEAFTLRDERWQLDATFEDEERVRTPPFEAVELEMGLWWTPTPVE